MQNIPDISHQASKLLVLYLEASIDFNNDVGLPSKITDGMKNVITVGTKNISRRGSFLPSHGIKHHHTR